MNSLPLCQLRYIQNLVDELQPPGEGTKHTAWWCDTLCVPVEPHLNKYRKLAIRQMRKINSSATKVLVLDSSLLLLSRESHPLELYIRLKLSKWMSRLWTLQEGVLATETHVQFMNGTKTLSSIRMELAEDSKRDSKVLYTRYNQLAGTFFSPFVQKTTQLGFTNVWIQAQLRSTSRQADETVCLATLLRLDPVSILNLPEDDYEGRMVQLLKMMPKIPLRILFQPPPRLTQHGFRWAPSSLLRCFRGKPANPFVAVNGDCSIGNDARGLSFKSPGVSFNSDNSRRLIAGEDCMINILVGETHQKYWLHYITPGDGTVERNDETQILIDPAIVTLTPLANDYEFGALVNVTAKENSGDTLQADFIATISLTPEKNWPSQIYTVLRLPEYSALITANDQDWLVY
jgi:hypothetical protein